MSSRDELQRFTYAERVIHWVAGLSFVFLLFTGLAFSHPRLFWITSLVGGGSTARFLHPWTGVLFTGSMVIMFAMWARDMAIHDGDRAWLKAMKHYAVHDKDNVPPAGKYNAGQKLFFWSMAFLGLLGLFTYGVAIPVHLFRRLKKESQDEGDQRFDPDFMESHGWLVRDSCSSVPISSEV